MTAAVPLSAAERSVSTSEDVDVCIVGAGVAGLVIAASTAGAGLRTVVLERGARPGGMLAPLPVGGGVLVDAGAESFATRTDAVIALRDEWSLPLEVVSPDPAGAWLVVPDLSGRGVRRARLPRRSILGIPADPAAADVAALVGPVAEKLLAVPDAEPSLAELVASRLGERLAGGVVDTVCRGVYSAPAARLRLSEVHPQLWWRFRERGSLTAAVADLITTGDRPGSAVAGIRGGLWRLADALAVHARAAGAIIETGTDVVALTATSDGAQVATSSGGLRARTVVVATGRADLDRLLGVASSDAATPVTIAIARIREPGLDAHPVGTGALVADAVAGGTKALTHANAKWGWLDDELAPHEHVVRLSARDAGASFDEVSIAEDASRIMGAAIAPGAIREVHVRHWDAASASMAPPPQPAAGIRAAGAAVAGTGLASVIPHARALADELIAAHARGTMPAALT